MTVEIRVAQHQNGFLKVALPGDWRAHVWSPWNPPTKHAAPAHGHPFDFFSFVAAGEMLNVRYDVSRDDSGSHSELVASCGSSFSKQEPLSAPVAQVTLRETGCDVIRRGEAYVLRAGQVHETRAVFAITLFKKLSQSGCHAPVYTPASSSPAREAFVSPPEALLMMSLDRALREARLTTGDLIEMSEKMSVMSAGALELMALPRAAAAGYHYVSAPRAHHGSALKVVEEAFELADAEAQSAKIMAACECADVLSAVRGYIGSSLSGVSMADVELMSQITDRAFAAGARSARV